MNAKTAQAKRTEYVRMPDSVRRAYATAGKASWASAQELANKNAEVVWRARSAVYEKQLEEMTAVCAAHAEETRALRAKLIDVETKAASAAHTGAANTNRRIQEITEEAQCVLKSADLVATHAANLKAALDAVQTSPEGPFAEIDAAQSSPIARCNCIDKRAVEGERSTNSKLAAVSLPPDSGVWSHLNSADVIAAARIILGAAGSLRAIGALSAGYAVPGDSVCDCRVEQTVSSDSPVGQDHHEI